MGYRELVVKEAANAAMSFDGRNLDGRDFEVKGVGYWASLADAKKADVKALKGFEQGVLS